MLSKKSGPRRYRSDLRAEQAQDTRLRVVEAAGRCFAATGYTATTLSAIAATAGVSVETVQSHGPKKRLLLAAVENASAGMSAGASAGTEGDRSILEVPEVAAVLALDDAREVLAGTAAFAAGLNGRIARLWQALAAAAQGDVDIHAAYTELQERIRADVLKVAHLLAARGQLRTDVSADEVAATTWVLIAPGQYELLVLHAGWTEARYRAWLERVLVEAVLPR